MTSLYNKLLTADVVCRDCGSKYGKYSVGCSSMWEGTCDVCDQTKPVTEVRDWGYLTKGLHELKENIKEQSKEVAEYMANQETDNKVTYKSTIIGVCVHRVDADHRTLQTEVKLEDEGGGEFITLTDTDGSQIRLDFEEFDEVVKAVAMLKGQ
jgi:hypothetical protein